jgi:hypothetical protein
MAYNAPYMQLSRCDVIILKSRVRVEIKLAENVHFPKTQIGNNALYPKPEFDLG